ncbi:MAG: hypothetical protein RI883_1022 [Bacteroidota bacterium]|jgi:flagellin-like hook-associated protein FlgL
MKKTTTLLFLLIGLVSFSQSNLTIFNNGGQQFYVILNGIKQNSVPMTNVSVGGIKNGSYSVKMIFADGKTADIDKNFFIEEPSDITTKIVFKKGKGKLQLIGMAPTAGANTSQGVLAYRPDNSAVYSDAIVTQTVTTQQTTTTNSGTTSGTYGNVTINQSGNVQSGTTNGSVNMSGTTNTNTNGQGVNQTVTVTDPNNPNGTVGMNVSINVSDPQMGGENVNMSVNMNGMGAGTQTTTNTTNTNNQSNQGNTQYSQNTTVTTTTTTLGTQSNTSNNTVNTSNNTNVNTSTNSVHPVVTCKNIMNDADAFVTDVKEIMMDDDKKDFILSQLTNFCLTASQAYKVTEALTFEDDRLIVAKFLYDRMIDKDKSNTLLPLFKFDDSKLEYAAYSKK